MDLFLKIRLEYLLSYLNSRIERKKQKQKNIAMEFFSVSFQNMILEIRL